MLGLLITDIQQPKHNITLAQDLSSFRTIETVQKAKSHWGHNADFTMVIGSDLLIQLPQWYRIRDLLQQVRVLIVPRPGYMINEPDLHAVQNLGGKINIAELNSIDVSSTAYREHGDTQALTSPIIAYINREHLYKCKDIEKYQIR